MRSGPPATLTSKCGEVSRHRRWPDRLYNLAAALLSLLPVAMVPFTRSSPAVLTAAALAALGGAALDDALPALWKRGVGALGQALGLSCLALAGWAVLSLLWSPFPLLSARVLGEFAIPIAAAFVLGLILPGRIDLAWWMRVAALAATAAGILIVLDVQTGLAVRATVGSNPIAFVLNRPTLTILVLVPGLAALLVRERQPWTATILALAAVGAVAESISGAAKLGLAVGLAVFALAWCARRMALGLVAGAMLGSVALAPMLGDVADRILPERLLAQLTRAHAQDRVDIWRSFGAAVRERPLTGTGFGTSASFGDTPAAQRVRPEFRPLLDVGHPHNAPLQIWAELGAVGAVLAALIMALTLRAIERLEGLPLALALALTGGGLAASLVGQGAWQGWWPAGIGASLVWFSLAVRDRV